MLDDFTLQVKRMQARIAIQFGGAVLGNEMMIFFDQGKASRILGLLLGLFIERFNINEQVFPQQGGFQLESLVQRLNDGGCVLTVQLVNQRFSCRTAFFS